jgi:hypothetical protein
MPTLRELQLNFVAALFDEADRRVDEHIRKEGLPAGVRLDFYRNNLHEGFIKTLATGFPAIKRLVGKDYFRQLAGELLRTHPSRSGNLHHVGEPFAPFLREKFDGTQYEYLSDVAALEWAHQKALIAADATPLTADAFRDVDSAQYEQLTFELHPSCSFVKSRYPIVRIWRANQPETASDEVIDLNSGGNNVLVLRTPECVELHRLPLPQFMLFESLGSGERLGVALDRAQSVEADFDLGAALRHLLELNILIGLRPKETP